MPPGAAYATPSSSSRFADTIGWPVWASTPIPGSTAPPGNSGVSAVAGSSPTWSAGPGAPQALSRLPSGRRAAASPAELYTGRPAASAVLEAGAAGLQIRPPVAEVEVAIAPLVATPSSRPAKNRRRPSGAARIAVSWFRPPA